MKRIQRAFEKMTFWNKVERCFGVMGSITVAELGMRDADPTWFVVIGILGLLGKMVHIWVEDVDNDGLVDIFEKEKDELSKH